MEDLKDKFKWKTILSSGIIIKNLARFTKVQELIPAP
jgi:hypothetical protein